MSWWKILVVLSSLVCWGHAQAPGDGDSICLTGALAFVHPTYPKTFKPLMDSRDYDQILEEAGAVWQQVDVDGNDGGGGLQTSWVQDVNLRCRQSATVCGFEVTGQDNWLITQHISREVGGVLLKQIIIIIEFEFATCVNTGDCSQTFTVHSQMTSTINAAVAATDPVNNFGLLSTVAPNDVTGEVRQNATIEFDFDDGETETGFYLAVRDIDSCLKIHRVLVYYSVCPAVIQDLIGLPESIAPPLLSTPIDVDMETCVMNAIPVFGQATPRARCLGGGQWSIVRECECVGGFQRNTDGTACEACAAGEYSVQGESCQSCPANSNSGTVAPECPCNEGYYRAASEGPETDCTQPPSAPQMLMAVNFTNTTVYLTWEAPLSDGGRDDTEYELSYERVDGSEPRTVYGKVAITEGEITGLTPFTDYIVSVSAENGVSSLATDATGRTDTVNIMTEEGTPSQITKVTPDAGSDKVVWDTPSDPGGNLLVYEVLITQNGTVVDTFTLPGTSTSLDVATRNLQPGDYEIQIRAVSSIGPGEYSTPVEITVGDNPSDSTSSGSDGGSNIVAIVVPVVIGAVLFVAVVIVVIILVVLWHRRNYVSSKDLPNAYAYREQFPLPEKPGYRMYVDPTTYTSTDDALQEFAEEIPPKSIRLEEEIGAGEFGTVYRGIWKQQGGKAMAIAVKTLKAGSSYKQRTDFLTEASIMGQFKHPNVITLYGVVTVVEPAMIVMEYMESGSLYSYLRRHDDKIGTYRLVKMSRGVASGMKYLAEVGYVHRDLAARNILVGRDETCKVADFGLSRETVNDEYDVQKGGKIPVRWTAPEAISYRKFTSSSDVWSFGILLWEVMSFAQHPYEDWDNQTVLDKLEAGLRLHKPKDCPDSVYGVMLECWNADHTRRPTFEQIVSKLDFLMETNMTTSTSNGPRKPPRPSKSKHQVRNPLEFETVDDWLRGIKMDKYIPNFQMRGLDQLNRCMELSEHDLQEMGITLPGHTHKIMTSIRNGHAQLQREPSVRI